MDEKGDSDQLREPEETPPSARFVAEEMTDRTDGYAQQEMSVLFPCLAL